MAKLRVPPRGEASCPLFTMRMAIKLLLCVLKYEAFLAVATLHVYVVSDSVFLFAAQLLLLCEGAEVPEEHLI